MSNAQLLICSLPGVLRAQSLRLLLAYNRLDGHE
jgi:hypothetical protein